MPPALLDFWKLFASEQADVAGGVALTSRPVPLSFANGVWQPDPDKLAEVVTWCRERNMPPAAFWSAAAPPPQGPGNPRLELSLETHSPAGAAREDTIVEQIGWQHCRPVAELFALRHDRMDVEEELSLVLARAMQRDDRMAAFLAYQEDRVAAAGVALIRQQGTVAWLEGDAAPALVAHLRHDVATSPLQVLQVRRDPPPEPSTGIGRWLLELADTSGP